MMNNKPSEKRAQRKRRQSMLTVKGHVLGEGRPLICAPVMKESEQEVRAEVIRLVGAGIPAIEWRMDALKGLSAETAARLLAGLAPEIGETILIATYRSKVQGGLGRLSAEEVSAIRRAAARGADLLDVEFDENVRVHEEIRALQELGSYVIASHHDFERTPPGNVIRQCLEEMKDSGADVVKLAVMPENMEDVLRIMGETGYFHRVYPFCPIITMAMGALGTLSRAAGEYFGSCLTFASAGEASAPGQLPAEELSGVLDLFHRALSV